MGHLKDPESPELLRAAISATLSLILLTTEHGTAQRFDQLCALLGDGIIGTAWLYASDSFEVILATVEALPPLMKALDIGIARYLKVLDFFYFEATRLICRRPLYRNLYTLFTRIL